MSRVVPLPRDGTQSSWASCQKHPAQQHGRLGELDAGTEHIVSHAADAPPHGAGDPDSGQRGDQPHDERVRAERPDRDERRDRRRHNQTDGVSLVRDGPSETSLRAGVGLLANSLAGQPRKLSDDPDRRSQGSSPLVGGGL